MKSMESIVVTGKRQQQTRRRTMTSKAVAARDKTVQ